MSYRVEGQDRTALVAKIAVAYLQGHPRLILKAEEMEQVIDTAITLVEATERKLESRRDDQC